MVGGFYCTYKGGFCDKEVANCSECVFAMESPSEEDDE